MLKNIFINFYFMHIEELHSFRGVCVFLSMSTMAANNNISYLTISLFASLVVFLSSFLSFISIFSIACLWQTIRVVRIQIRGALNETLKGQ